jgi:DNA-directed RNA polymerase subunit M/transcription elongation factor TFIIS
MPWRTVLDTVVRSSTEFLVSDEAALTLDAENTAPCAHSQRGLFEIIVGSGQRPYYELCTECGSLLKAIPKKISKKRPAFFDHKAIQKCFAKIRYERRIEIIKKDALENGHAVRERKHSYPAYLRSKEWLEKRQAVLQRAKFVCEECGEEQATEIHHATYERIIFERLEDLAAVCARCHSQLHIHNGVRIRSPLRRPLNDLPCLGCRWFDGCNQCAFYQMPVGAALTHSESCGADLHGFEGLR